MLGLLVAALLAERLAGAAPACFGGLVYSECHSICPLVCGAAAPAMCSQVCLAGCACAPEKWRKDGDSSECLDEADCANDVDDATKARAPQPCLSTYSWCAASASCIRRWDTICESDAAPEAPASDAPEPVTAKNVGGRDDGEPCLNSAGYSWCGATASCLRAWESPCPPSPAPTTGPTRSEPTEHHTSRIAWSTYLVVVLAAFVFSLGVIACSRHDMRCTLFRTR
jgi:hypothetical protein